MALENWDKSPDGKVVVHPLVAFETVVAHGIMCGLKVHYFASPDDLLAGRSSSVPLLLRPEMARQLAAALLKSANEAEHGPTTENQSLN